MLDTMNAKTPLLLALATLAWAQPEVLINGLEQPQKLILTPGGNLLVTEPNVKANLGRVSLVSRSGVRRSLFEGLPSGAEVTGGGSGPTAMAIRDRTLYLALSSCDAERRGTVPGTSVHNPAGISSPLVAVIVTARFNQSIDAIMGTFKMTPDQQRILADGGQVELSDGSGATAMMEVLSRFPVAEPDANAVYRFSNLWGLALTPDGATLYVNDASMNSLARVDTATGRWQRIMRFAPLRNPTPVGPPVLDSVPTSVRIYGDQVLVSFLTGFPFIPGTARVLSVNPETRTAENFINFNTSAVDILWRDAGGTRPQFFVLEFSQNQSATPAAPGRLVRYDTVQGEVVLTDLRGPTSLAYDAATKDLFILEISGRILRLRLE